MTLFPEAVQASGDAIRDIDGDELFGVPAPGRDVVLLRNPSDRGGAGDRREQQSRIPPLYSSVPIPPLPVLNQPNGGLKRTEVL
ncbi:hypothetical protein NC652_041461 [Populus alba x Populus x berolinensis]|nr:hypothetical protein NC652_041461 [Populus alba x Populus x berolinensis]